MQNNFLKQVSLLMTILFLATAGPLFSQTAGTLSFSVTTTSTGGYSPDHLLAIWIENNSGAFIKTKIRYAGTGDLDHMQTWVNKSNKKVVDAVTGATRTSHGTLTFLWNGTNASGALVPDGAYNIWLEMAWGSSLTTGKTVNSFPFTKGAAPFRSTPANTANFLSMAIDWTPTTTSSDAILENSDISVWPNPTSGLVNINFKNPKKEILVQFASNDGKIVHSKILSNISTGIQTFDLSGKPTGLYFCRIISGSDQIVFGIVLSK